MQATLLTNGVGSGTSVTTASISPTAGKLVVIFVGNFRSGATATNPTITGASTTWTRQLTETSADTESKIHLFYAFAAGTGALTIDMSGINQTDIMWSVAQFSGTNLSSAVVQFAGNHSAASSTGITVTLSAFGNISNAAHGAVYDRAARAITIGSGFTSLSNQQSAGTLVSEWRNDNDTTVDWSWGSASANVCAIGLEIIGLSTGGFFAFL